MYNVMEVYRRKAEILGRKPKSQNLTYIEDTKTEDAHEDEFTF
jgi:hypothetical protein